MTEFVQFHLLTTYPPSNLNRDDLGRPKTAVVGGTTRLRISSQSLKRAWRESDLFAEVLAGKIGVRTKRMGGIISESLCSGILVSNLIEKKEGSAVNPQVEKKKADTWASAIAGAFGAIKKDNKLEIEQLVHFGQDEIAAIDRLVSVISRDDREPNEEELTDLHKVTTDVDIALFGRMLAKYQNYSIEAAAQVAHAITVHAVTLEDDYFTAVDDLNKRDDTMGAAHVGVTEFGAGIFYEYICVNRDLLVENLKGDETLADRTLSTFLETICKVGPKGKQNSFASRSYASYTLIERGTQQPRSLAASFIAPLNGHNLLTDAVKRLQETREQFNSVYGPCADEQYEMNVLSGTGSLEEGKVFLAGQKV
ncbi:MAG: type I-E CRISPR-associated protein Cas7/Cse4/CasC [Methanocalculus sp.]|uniref:type I-E CRISPR-associated protein Cas7/Cse4/CasC n=1 Tax=Methanocalculus sp. TaxID=2004547 RepID=UPI002720F45D|nr:type I-E CRISPR-associated protein Cas7/Cse4/CasC [Methanocalculus sp.]MDO9538581.1 type I-E CRISPR-associated protein Cas7/Cse4/CasC [Methanocalculus sp.]